MGGGGGGGGDRIQAAIRDCADSFKVKRKSRLGSTRSVQLKLSPVDSESETVGVFSTSSPPRRSSYLRAGGHIRSPFPNTNKLSPLVFDHVVDQAASSSIKKGWYMGFCRFYLQSSKEKTVKWRVTRKVPLGPEWKDPLKFSKAFQITTMDKVRFFIFKLSRYKISCIPYMIYKLMYLTAHA